MEERIRHIALPDDWRHAQCAGAYSVSTRGVSLAEEGFIHCSFDRQVERTANAYYGDLDELVLLTIDTDRLEAPVVVEPPFPDAPDDFPHVYGAIPVSAVVAAEPWTRVGDTWRLDGQGPLKTASEPAPSSPE
jgi:glutathione S-transferase